MLIDPQNKNALPICVYNLEKLNDFPHKINKTCDIIIEYEKDLAIYVLDLTICQFVKHRIIIMKEDLENAG